MLSAEVEDKNFFNSLDIVQDRGQSVVAQVGSTCYEGLESPILLAQDTSGGCGGMIWEAANVMIEYFIWKQKESEDFLTNKTVIELGSGTGLVGLTIAKIYSKVNKVILTDQLPMMNLMLENIKLNKLGHLVQAEILNWGEEIPNELSSNVDVILASDCVYLEIAFIPLIETLLALSTKDTLIYLAYKKRRKADKRFFQLAKKKFEFTEVMDDPKREEYNRQSLKLFVFKKK
ncbi:hypothetical protein G6F43_005775 [Rhizopus delemar]|nr:hypothetical protein G6F43_005775 [Rhizopus delemar]